MFLQDYDAATTINYIETLQLGSEDTATPHLAIIEIDSNDYMNAFHDAGSCPLQAGARKQQLWAGNPLRRVSELFSWIRVTDY